MNKQKRDMVLAVFISVALSIFIGVVFSPVARADSTPVIAPTSGSDGIFTETNGGNGLYYYYPGSTNGVDVTYLSGDCVAVITTTGAAGTHDCSVAGAPAGVYAFVEADMPSQCSPGHTLEECAAGQGFGSYTLIGDEPGTTTIATTTVISNPNQDVANGIFAFLFGLAIVLFAFKKH